jgi:hypothetical protein
MIKKAASCSGRTFSRTSGQSFVQETMLHYVYKDKRVISARFTIYVTDVIMLHNGILLIPAFHIA